MIKHIRLAATREYELSIVHPAFTADEINHITNFLQWVEPTSLTYAYEGIMAFLIPENHDGRDPGSAVRVEFAPEHLAGYMSAEDSLKYRAFLMKSTLETVIGVCDAGIYGKRPDLGRPMVFRLCLALDVDNLHAEDPSSWTRKIYP
jgi:hypothetical protein